MSGQDSAEKGAATCRLCGEPVHVDGDGIATHRDGLGSHDAEPNAAPTTPAGGHPASGDSVCRAPGCGEAATAPPAGHYDDALMAAFRAARDEVPATEARVVASRPLPPAEVARLDAYARTMRTGEFPAETVSGEVER